MNLSNFLIRVVFLALPGIVGSRLYNKLTHNRNRKNWEYFLEIAMFSLASYALYGFAVEICGYLGWADFQTNAFQAIVDENPPIFWFEIVTASVIGTGLAFLATFLHTKKVVFKIAWWMGVTNRFGDEDVWDLFHNSPEASWVFVRDHKQNLLYSGWVRAFSDSEATRELLLREVKVHLNSTGELLYETEALYLSRNTDDLTIEIPTVKSN